MTKSLQRACLLAAALVVLPLSFAEAASYVTWKNSGSSSNRVDFVVVAEGYTSSQMSQFQADAATLMNGVFAQEPYKRYVNYYNVQFLLTTSAQSGADHPESGTSVSTAFDATYNCGGIQRLICVDTAKVSSAVNASFPSSAYRDQVLVLVNDTAYGGSGGAIAVASTNSSAVELVLHEVGHSFGLLADEYDSNPELCDPAEPAETNSTTQTSRTSIKWRQWIASSTPLPTTGTAAGVPGAYLGSRYCPSGMYRPTYNSKMRALGQPFEQINVEQHIRRIYTFVSSIDSYSPTGSSVSVGSSPVTFQVSPLLPIGGSLTGTWYVDGVAAGSGMTFSSNTLTSGTHSLQAVVNDPTAMVRSDPSQLLVESVTWTVNKSGGNTAPVAQFSFTTSGLAATFTDSSTDADGTIASRTWSFGDGTTSTATNPTKTYAADGTYPVSLAVTDNGGASGSTSRQVTVSGDGGCGGTTYTGSIGAQGSTQIQPNGTWYQSTAPGTHVGCLNGPAGADFDLFLDRWTGSAWSQVAASESPTAVEKITYQATAGYYRWRVVAFSGTGSYTFQLLRP